MREQVIERIEKEKLIAIVRGVSADQCSKVANALYAGGVRLMEITYNQKDPASWQQTAEAIGALTEEFGDKMLFGAGTVTSVELVELTHAHGGKYIISPDTNVDVIKRTVELGMVSLPGAMTPTEVMTAHEAGADFVKLFPAGDLVEENGVTVLGTRNQAIECRKEGPPFFAGRSLRFGYMLARLARKAT